MDHGFLKCLWFPLSSYAQNTNAIKETSFIMGIFILHFNVSSELKQVHRFCYSLSSESASTLIKLLEKTTFLSANIYMAYCHQSSVAGLDFIYASVSKDYMHQSWFPWYPF